MGLQCIRNMITAKRLLGFCNSFVMLLNVFFFYALAINLLPYCNAFSVSTMLCGSTIFCDSLATVLHFLLQCCNAKAFAVSAMLCHASSMLFLCNNALAVLRLICCCNFIAMLLLCFYTCFATSLQWLRDGSRKNQFLPGRFAQKRFFERDVSSRDDYRFQGIIYQNLSIKCNVYIKLIMNLFEIYSLYLIFLSNMFCSYFFPNLGDDSPTGRFAQMYFSVITTTFCSKEGTKKPYYQKINILLNV